MVPENAAALLKQLMVMAKVPSLRALSRQAGVSEWAVQQLKRGRIGSMRVSTVKKLAVALQLSLPALLRHFQGIEAEAKLPEPTVEYRDRTATLEAEYQRLQTQLRDQEPRLRQQFQQDALKTIEPWLLQWPTVIHAIANNPDLPALRLLPLMQPIQDLLEDWNIKATASIGTVVPYDPYSHQLIDGTAAESGAPVKVRYAGFVQGDTLLYRAKVSRLV